MGQTMISFYVRLSARSRSHFLIDFHEKWRRGKKRELKTSSFEVNIGPHPSLLCSKNCPQNFRVVMPTLEIAYRVWSENFQTIVVNKKYSGEQLMCSALQCSLLITLQMKYLRRSMQTCEWFIYSIFFIYLALSLCHSVACGSVNVWVDCDVCDAVNMSVLL